MEAAGSTWSDLLGGLVGVARDYVTDGVSVSIKTNYAPEIAVATASLGSSSSSSGGAGAGGRGLVATLLGVKTAVIVRNQRGEIISTFGEVPKTDPVRAIVATVVLGGLLWLIVRGALK